MWYSKSWWLLLVFTHITKVKQRRARLVSGWVTAQEYWMPKTFQLSPNHNLLDFNAVFGSFWLKHYNLKVFYKFSKSKLSEPTGFRTQDRHNLKSETITITPPVLSCYILLKLCAIVIFFVFESPVYSCYFT